uniref:Pseudouridine kinase n=1 Tax=Opuntia streptacantha TaxID=393608 RepID=A0A7C9AUK5_OPUST
MGKEMDQVNGMPIIIGGMVLDIHATASVPSSSKSTTPGKIEYMHGGVARNVAECLFKLGTKLYMISAVGHDMAGDKLLELWISARLPVEGILQGSDIKTAVVCNMFDVDGELTAGVASVESIVSGWICHLCLGFCRCLCSFCVNG